MRNKAALLVDIGGGSTEVTLATGGNILSTESFKMGAVRMLQQLEGKKHGERHFNQLVQEYVEATQKRIKREVGNRTIDLCVGTGGNVDTIGELRKQMLGRDRDTVVTLSGARHADQAPAGAHVRGAGLAAPPPAGPGGCDRSGGGHSPADHEAGARGRGADPARRAEGRAPHRHGAGAVRRQARAQPRTGDGVGHAAGAEVRVRRAARDDGGAACGGALRSGRAASTTSRSSTACCWRWRLSCTISATS